MLINDEQPQTITALTDCMSNSYETAKMTANKIKPFAISLAKAGMTISLESVVYTLSILNLGTMLAELFRCLPTDTKAQCYTKITPNMQLTQLITIGLNMAIIAIVGSYWLTSVFLKRTNDIPYVTAPLTTVNRAGQYFLGLINQASKESLKCFLFLFQMVIGFSGYISYIVNVGDPAKQGNISNGLFGVETGACAITSLGASNVVQDSSQQKLLDCGFIAPSIKEISDDKFKLALTGLFAVCNSFFLAIPSAAEINYNVTTFQKITAIQTGNAEWISSTPADIVRWSMTGIAFTLALIHHLCRNYFGENENSSKLGKLASVCIAPFTLFSMLYSLYNVIITFTLLTSINLGASLVTRTAEYITLPFVKKDLAQLPRQDHNIELVPDLEEENPLIPVT